MQCESEGAAASNRPRPWVVALACPAKRGVWVNEPVLLNLVQGLLSADVCPVGTFDNSPVIYRWVSEANDPTRPVGTVEASRLLKRKRLHVRMHSTVPTGRRNFIFNRFPALKCWAIFNCPSGARFRSTQYVQMPTNHHATHRDIITPDRQSLPGSHGRRPWVYSGLRVRPRLDARPWPKRRTPLSCVSGCGPSPSRSASCS